MKKWWCLTLLLVAQLTLLSREATGQLATLTRDLNPTVDGEGAPRDYIHVFLGRLGDRAVFSVPVVRSLWSSDGTLAGTEALVPGRYLGAIGDRGYIVQGAPDGSNLFWRTDGTARGTVPVSIGGGATAFISTLFEPIALPLGQNLVFSDQQRLRYLSDQEEIGTVPLGISLDGAITMESPGQMLAAQSGIFVMATHDDSSSGLWWLSDVNSPPTLVHRFDSAAVDVGVLVSGDRSFILEVGFEGNSSLFSSRRGSPSALLADLGRADFLKDSWQALPGESMLFQRTVVGDTELWFTDGTASGTREFFTVATRAVVVEPVDGGVAVGAGGDLSIVDLDGRLRYPPIEDTSLLGVFEESVFLGEADFGRPAEVQRLDARTGELESVLEVVGDQIGGIAATAQGFLFYFRYRPPGNTDIGTTRSELWLTDGTAVGTRLLLERRGGVPFEGVDTIDLGDTLLFGWRGLHAWTPSRSRAIQVHRTPLPPDSFAVVRPIRGSPSGTTLYFSTLEESYSSQGTPSTTLEMATTDSLGCFSGGQFSGPLIYAVLGDDQIEVCDPSSLLIRDRFGSPRRLTFQGASVSLSPSTEVEGELLFSAAQPERPSARPLAVTDGTAAGSKFPLDLSPEEAFVTRLQSIGDVAYFFVCSTVLTCNLGRYEDGTAQVLGPVNGGSPISELVVHSGRIYWVTSDFASPTKVQSVDLSGGDSREMEVDSDPLTLRGLLPSRRGPILIDGRLLRIPEAAGEAAVDLSPPGIFLGPENIVSTGNEIFFVGMETSGGANRELWATDGSSSGTRLVRDILPGISGSEPLGLVPFEDRVIFSAFSQEEGRELWSSDGTSAGTRLLHDLNPGPESSSPAAITLAGSRAFFFADNGLTGFEIYSMDLASNSCQDDRFSHCLNDGRFRVEMTWNDFEFSGGRGVALPLTEDTGAFWFFDAQNVEAVIKVLDGTPINDFFWVFAGSLTNVPFTLTVSDSVTGQAKRYVNPPRNFSSFGDTRALGSAAVPKTARLLGRSGVGASPRAEEALETACATSPTALCVGDRFLLEVNWTDFQGNSGRGRAVEFTEDTGNFWFFDPDNIELTVKVLDAREVNGHFWVFFGSLSNVSYSLRVVDTLAGTAKNYSNPLGRFGSIGDTLAFPE